MWNKIINLVDFHSRFLTIIAIAIVWLCSVRWMLLDYGFNGSASDIFGLVFGSTMLAILVCFGLMTAFIILWLLSCIIPRLCKCKFWSDKYKSEKNVVIEYVNEIKRIMK